MLKMLSQFTIFIYFHNIKSVSFLKHPHSNHVLIERPASNGGINYTPGLTIDPQ